MIWFGLCLSGSDSDLHPQHRTWWVCSWLYISEHSEKLFPRSTALSGEPQLLRNPHLGNVGCLYSGPFHGTFSLERVHGIWGHTLSRRRNNAKVSLLESLRGCWSSACVCLSMPMLVHCSDCTGCVGPSRHSPSTKLLTCFQSSNVTELSQLSCKVIWKINITVSWHQALAQISFGLQVSFFPYHIQWWEHKPRKNHPVGPSQKSMMQRKKLQKCAQSFRKKKH